MGTPGAVKCNEHPDIYFTLETIDKGHLLRRMRAVAAMQRRNYVLMDVRDNLIAESREELLKPFSSDAFKKIAHVQLGEGNAEFKKKALEVALQKKQDASDKAFRAEKVAEKRAKLAETRKKEVEKAKKKQEKERTKKIAEGKKKVEAARKE